MERTFTDAPAVRTRTPLIITLFSPSGGGKTWSALDMATGIQKVFGGDIYGEDSENRRMLHYAFDQATGKGFKFRHVPFASPFSPDDYLECHNYVMSKKPGVIIIDSMSHEHDGPGGLLEMHEAEITRMAGDDYGKREKVNLAGWIKPKQARRRFLNALVQASTDTAFILCFRAKESTKMQKDEHGKNQMVYMGFDPIGGPEYVFEATVSFLLLPKSDGKPTLKSDFQAERLMMKIPEQFKSFLTDGVQLNADIGEKLARWAKGESTSPASQPPPNPPAPSAEPSADLKKLIESGDRRASQGSIELAGWWDLLTKQERIDLKSYKEKWKEIAAKHDASPS